MQAGLQTSHYSVLRVQRKEDDSGRKWPVGQVVKTAASQAAIGSSTLPRVTKKKNQGQGKENAPLAQLVEHLTLNQGVQGSSP